MRKPAEAREGDTFRFSWDELEVVVSNVREASGDPTGIVDVAVNNGTRRALLAPTRLNLVAARSRAEIANALHRRGAFGGWEQQDWLDCFEVVCGRTYRLWKKGVPTIRLAEHTVSRVSRDIITRFAPAGETTILYGDGGSMKSTVALGLAIAVCEGRAMTERLAPTLRGPVIYLDWETTEDEMSERAQSLAAHFGLEGIPTDLHYRSMAQALADDIERVRADVDRLGAVMVVVDSLGWACGSEPEKASSAIATMNALKSLGSRTARVCVAHITHEGARQRTGGVEIFGSRFWRHGARATWETRTEEAGSGDANSATVGLFQRKVNRGMFRPPLALRFRFHPLGEALEELPFAVEDVRVADTSSDLTGRLPLTDRILGALEGGRLTVKQIADEAEATQAQVRARLSDLKKRGTVERDGSLWGRVRWQGDAWWEE